MRTIEEAAKEWCDNNDNSHGYDAFRAGAEFAQTWIDVNEELPIYGVDVNVRFTDKNGKVKQCTASFELINQYNTPDSPKFEIWFVFPWGGHELNTVTHWRPIDLK